MSSELRIYLPGSSASGDARRALKIVQGVIDLLDKLDEQDRADEGKDHIRWGFSELTIGSVGARIAVDEPRRHQELEAAEALFPKLVLGLHSLEERPFIPDGWEDESAKKADTLLKSSKHLSLELQVLGDLATDAYTITSAAQENLKQALSDRMTTIGSLTGTLEMVNFHGDRPVARLWLEAPNRPVTVYFDEKQSQKMKDALRTRVQVSGEIKRDRAYRAESIKLRSLRRMKARSAKELIALAGSIPDFTGGLSTDEYMEELRGAS